MDNQLINNILKIEEKGMMNTSFLFFYLAQSLL